MVFISFLNFIEFFDCLSHQLSSERYPISENLRQFADIVQARISLLSLKYVQNFLNALRDASIAIRYLGSL